MRYLKNEIKKPNLLQIHNNLEKITNKRKQFGDKSKEYALLCSVCKHIFRSNAQ